MHTCRAGPPPERRACSLRCAAHRLGHQTSARLASRARASGWPDFVFAFHDNDEIGPRVLARIAKHTGLRPEDL